MYNKIAIKRYVVKVDKNSYIPLVISFRLKNPVDTLPVKAINVIPREWEVLNILNNNMILSREEFLENSRMLDEKDQVLKSKLSKHEKGVGTWLNGGLNKARTIDEFIGLGNKIFVSIELTNGEKNEFKLRSGRGLKKIYKEYSGKSYVKKISMHFSEFTVKLNSNKKKALELCDKYYTMVSNKGEFLDCVKNGKVVTSYTIGNAKKNKHKASLAKYKAKYNELLFGFNIVEIPEERYL